MPAKKGYGPFSVPHVAIDRPAILRNAEKLLRQGKLEPAIAEYLRVVEDQPRDWNTANILGDLYMRAGHSDKAVEQFARIADGLKSDGFLPKAAALYKKVLKIRPDDEHALLQAGEIAAVQGVLVDARTYLNAVADRRLARDDRHGAAEIRIRLGSLDPADFDARRMAARARVEMGDGPGALRDLKDIAADLAQKGRGADAVEVLREAAELDPDDQDVRSQLFTAHIAVGDLEAAEPFATTPDELKILGRAYIDRGDMTSATRFLTAETAADDPELLLTIAEARLRSGATDEGLAIVRQLLNQDPARGPAITSLGCDVAAAAPDAGFAVVEMAAETSVIEGDWPSAAAALQEFVTRVHDHIPALMRLVEICFDGSLEATLHTAQWQLADAYLAAGAAAEARVIAEDLMARDPSEPRHVEQLRRALAMLGEEDPDRVIAERLSAAAEDASAAAASRELGLDTLAETQPTAPARTQPTAESPANTQPTAEPAANTQTTAKASAKKEPAAHEPADKPSAETITPAAPHAMEVDLSEVLADFRKASVPPAERPPTKRPPAAPDPSGAHDLDEVFEQFRGEALSASERPTARSEYERGVALRDAGRIDESIKAFQIAAREPRLRFHAAAALGRLYQERDGLHQAVEWFEQAAQAPAPSSDEAHALFYELAEALESLGEMKRALAILLELRAEAGAYRDVSARINRLAKVQTRG